MAPVHGVADSKANYSNLYHAVGDWSASNLNQIDSLHTLLMPVNDITSSVWTWTCFHMRNLKALM